MLLEYYDEHFVVTNMRKQILQYLKGMSVPNEIKLKLMTNNSIEDTLNILENIFKK